MYMYTSQQEWEYSSHGNPALQRLGDVHHRLQGAVREGLFKIRGHQQVLQPRKDNKSNIS